MEDIRQGQMENGPELDDVLRALGDVRRRYVVAYLRDVEAVALADVARDFVAWRSGQPDDESPDLDRTYFGLYHVHVPALEAVDAVDFDADRNVLQRGPQYSATRRCLDRIVGPPE